MQERVGGVMKRLKYLMTLALILVLGIMIYYYYVNKDTETDNNKDDVEVSEVDKLLAKDLDDNYPKTAREVVSYFVSIQECYYNEEYTDDKLVQLSYQAMKLFDNELIENNEFDEYYENLGLEIDEYKSSEKTITKTILDKASDIIYSEIDGVRYASMNCIYYLKTEDETTKVTEKYALRCDDEGKWKILGWEIYTPSDYEE